jgi:hypothetical protein
MSQGTYEGGCFCGAVQLTATGGPEAMDGSGMIVAE